MSGGFDEAQVLAELEPVWLEGLEGDRLEEGRGLLLEVVDDWAREADGTPDPAAVLRIQRADLDKMAEGGADRLQALRTRVLQRKVDRLGSMTFALGKAILGGSVEDEQARTEGRDLLAEAEELAGELDALGPSPWSEAIRRELGDAVLEGLYAVERKAMSPRLAREAGDSGPPSVF